MKGKHFATSEEIKEKSKQQLAGDSTDRVSEMFRGFRGLEKIWHNRNHALTTVFSGLGHRWHCHFSKTEDIEMKGMRFVTIEEIKEKSKQQLADFSKIRVSEVFWWLENTL